jgi:hypothetical protein
MPGYLIALGSLVVLVGLLLLSFSEFPDDGHRARRHARVARWATRARLVRAAGVGVSVVGAFTIFASVVPSDELGRWIRDLFRTDDPSAATAAWLAVLATLVIALALAVSGTRQRAAEKRQERQTAMTNAHVSLGTGEVAAARHAVGTLLHSRRERTIRRDVRRHRSDYVKHFYTLIWADEFIHNLRRVWTSGVWDGKESAFLSWNEAAIDESVIRLRTQLIISERAFEDSSAIAWERFVDRKRKRGESTTLTLLDREDRKVLRHRGWLVRCR